MKIAILGTRGIPNNYGGFEQCAEYLSVGLAERGHEITVYSPSFHPYKKKRFKGVNIIKKPSPQYFFGHSASNFIYDYLCLRDAVDKDFDIIIELGLITSALSIIFCRHKGKLIATNIDGLEWKRSKWNVTIQHITRLLEKYGIRFSDYLISDNKAIQNYIKNEYQRDSECIAYGATEINEPNKEYLSQYNITSTSYILSIARLEPENNLEMMCDAYIQSKTSLPYYIIGNHLSKYGDFLKDKYRRKGIVFLGAIFNKDHLDTLRYYSTYYLHGHSVGGTNPALLEAMAAKSFIIAHDNPFNRAVLSSHAFYFKTSCELTALLKNNSILDSKERFIAENLDVINKKYRWPHIIDSYEKYLLKILNQKVS